MARGGRGRTIPSSASRLSIAPVTENEPPPRCRDDSMRKDHGASISVPSPCIRVGGSRSPAPSLESEARCHPPPNLSRKGEGVSRERRCRVPAKLRLTGAPPSPHVMRDVRPPHRADHSRDRRRLARRAQSGAAGAARRRQDDARAAGAARRGLARRRGASSCSSRGASRPARRRGAWRRCAARASATRSAIACASTAGSAATRASRS